jgi:hypothetical protein
LNYTVGGEPMIWFIPDNEKDKNGEKTDYVSKEGRPQQFKSIKKRATERLRKHDRELSNLFK